MCFGTGGKTQGQSTSTATQGVDVSFIPNVTETETITPAPVLVSPFPAGQGLQTINTALPTSAAFNPASYINAAAASPAPASAAISLPSTSTLLAIAAAGAAAWFFLIRRRR